MSKDLRIPGIATGMDTQDTINKIMKYTRMPLDRLKQKQQKIIWKQEAYRTQNLALSQLKDLAFGLKLQSSYATKAVSSSNTQAVTATAANGAQNASFSMNIQELATAATNGSMAPTVLRSRTIGVSQASVTVDATHNSFKMTLDGVQRTIDLSAYNGVYNAGVNLNDLETNLQTELNGQFGAGKVFVKLTSTDQFEFYTNDGVNHNITLNDGAANSILGSLGFTNGAVSDKTGLPLKSSLWNNREQFMNSTFFEGKSVSDSFQITLNGQTFNFKYDNTTEYIIDVINSNTTAGVRASYDEYNDKLILTATQTGDYNHGNYGIEISDPNNVLSQVFRIDQTNEVRGKNAKFTLNGATMERESNNFTIDNVTFNLTGLTPAGSPAQVKVSTDTSGLVTKISDFVKKYNEVIASLNGKVSEDRASSGKYKFYEPLSEEQRKEMDEGEIKAWEEKAKQGLLHNDSILRGTMTDMRLAMNRLVDTPRTLSGLSLSDTGVDLTANNMFTFKLGAEIRQITLDAVNYAPGQYNLLQSDLQQKLDQAFGQGRVLVSLTTTKKLEFTTQNSAVTLTAAGSNDALGLLGFNNGANVKASYNQLSQIGITTGSYLENGKLYLDTEKLTTALQADPDGVLRLLTNSETVTPKTTDPVDVANAKALGKNRRGIFFNFYDTLYADITKITNEAGSSGNAYNSKLGKELLGISDNMERVQDRITMEEDRLWNLFSQMEQMVARMNSQSAFLSNAFGNGQ